MSRIDEVRKAMQDAMKAKDKDRKDALSMLLAALKNKAIDKRADLTPEEENEVVLKEIKQTKETLELTPADRTDIIEECKFRIRVLEEFAPHMMDEAEIRQVITAVLQELSIDAPTGKDKGRIMKVLMKKSRPGSIQAFSLCIPTAGLFLFFPDLHFLFPAPSAVVLNLIYRLVSADSHVIGFSLFQILNNPAGLSLYRHRFRIFEAAAGGILDLVSGHPGNLFPVYPHTALCVGNHSGEGGLFRHDVKIQLLFPGIGALSLYGNNRFSDIFILGIGNRIIFVLLQL